MNDNSQWAFGIGVSRKKLTPGRAGSTSTAYPTHGANGKQKMQDKRAMVRRFTEIETLTASFAQHTVTEADVSDFAVYRTMYIEAENAMRKRDREKRQKPIRETARTREVSQADSALSAISIPFYKRSALGKRSRAQSVEPERPGGAKKVDVQDRKCRLLVLPAELHTLIIEKVVEYERGDKPSSYLGLARSCRTFYYETCEAALKVRVLRLQDVFQPHQFFEMSRLYSDREKQSSSKERQTGDSSRLLVYEQFLRQSGQMPMQKPALLPGLPRIEWITQMCIQGWAFGSLMELFYSIRSEEMKPFQFPSLKDLVIRVPGVDVPVPCPWISVPAEVYQYYKKPEVLSDSGGLRVGLRLMETLLVTMPRLQQFWIGFDETRESTSLGRRDRFSRDGYTGSHTATVLWICSPTGDKQIEGLARHPERICRELRSPPYPHLSAAISAKFLYMTMVLVRFVRRSLQQRPGSPGERSEANYVPMTDAKLEELWRTYKHNLDTLNQRVLVRRAVAVGSGHMNV